MFHVCDRVARLIKVGRDCCCGVCVEWIVRCLSMFFKAFTKSAFSFTYVLFFLFVCLFFFFFCRSASLAFSFALFHTSSDVMAKISLYTVVFPYPRLFVMET